MTQILPDRLDTTGGTHLGIRSALWLPASLATEILTNLTTTLVYCETVVWQYRQCLLGNAHQQGTWTPPLEQAMDACVAEYSCKLDQLEEEQVTQCLQLTINQTNGESKTVGDRWRVRSNNPFLLRSTSSRPRRVRQKGLRMKKNVRILIQRETQETLIQLHQIISDYRRLNREQENNNNSI